MTEGLLGLGASQTEAMTEGLLGLFTSQTEAIYHFSIYL